MGDSVDPIGPYQKGYVKEFLDYHIANGDMDPVVFCVVQGTGTWYRKDDDGNGRSNIVDLMSMLEDKYCVSSDPKERIIAGMSAGAEDVEATKQSELELAGLVMLPAGYLDKENADKMCDANTRPNYLFAAVSGASDGGSKHVTAALPDLPYSDNTLFLQTVQGDGHDVGSATRYTLRMTAWYFASSGGGRSSGNNSFFDRNNNRRTGRPSVFPSSLNLEIGATDAEKAGASQKGQWTEVTFNSRKMWVYTPYGFNANGTQKYNFILLKNGYSAGENHSSGQSFTLNAVSATKCDVANFLDYHIANGDIDPVVYVSLDGERSGNTIWLSNDNDRNGKSNLRELVEYFEANYNISTNPKDRILTGMSNGTMNVRSCSQSDKELFGIVYYSSAYGVDTDINAAAGASKPAYLVVVTAGVNPDPHGICNEGDSPLKCYALAAGSQENSGGHLFAQQFSSEGHYIASAVRGTMRLALWYFGGG